MTKNQPELKACELKSCPFCGSAGMWDEGNSMMSVCCSNVDCWMHNQVPDFDEWNARPSPIIPEDAYPKPIEEKTVPEEFDNLIADDALLEAVNRSAGMQSFLSHYGHEMWVKDIETLVNRAIKGQKKPVEVTVDDIMEKICHDVIGDVNGTLWDTAVDMCRETLQATARQYPQGIKIIGGVDHG